jgi:alkylation response protein AidB-like acyl-CoA dehydrogenase
MPTATAASKIIAPKPAPVPNGDFYQLVDLLTPEEKAVVKKVRTYMETKVQPIINKYWSDDAFPFELLPSFKELGIGGLGYEGYGCAGGSQKQFGFVAMELARVDASLCTFFGVHSGLAMGSIYLDGSEEQKQKWLPPMARWEKIGCFGLTEPLVGSGSSGGLTTTAKREGDTWILNGQKRWIGNAPWCDVSIIWARDLGDNQVKGFIVENKSTLGFSVEKIEHKIALKVVQNGQITLKDVRVPEANRLQGGNSFRDTARVLRMTRYMVGWASTGIQMGAFEATVKYAQERLQFGKPIASFQMIQVIGGSALPKALAKRALAAGIDIFAGYGMSETGPLAAVSHVRSKDLTGDPDGEVEFRARAGIAAPLVDLLIVDSDMKKLPHDGKSAGEIVLRAPWLTQGYFNNPEGSEQLWAGGYLHTSDIAVVSPDGYVHITDRIKDVIKTGGEWVSSLQIEDLISQCAGVAEAAVIGVKDDKWGERPLALVVKRASDANGVSDNAIKDHLKVFADKGIISKYGIPEKIIFIDSIPKTSVGKINKKELRERYSDM